MYLICSHKISLVDLNSRPFIWRYGHPIAITIEYTTVHYYSYMSCLYQDNKFKLYKFEKKSQLIYIYCWISWQLNEIILQEVCLKSKLLIDNCQR